MDVKETIDEIFKDWIDQVKDDGGFMSYIAANGGYEKEVQNFLAFQLQKKRESSSELILMERTITNGSKDSPRKKVDILAVDPSIKDFKEGEAFFLDSDKNRVKINYGIELKHRMYKDSIISNTELPIQDWNKCFKAGLRRLYTVSIITDCKSCRSTYDEVQVKYRKKISCDESNQKREIRLKKIDDNFKNLDSNCRRIVVEYPEFQNAKFYSHIYICDHSPGV